MCLSELPPDILKLILYKLNYQSIINLCKIHENFAKLLKDPMTWCEFLVQHKDYDDNSFCYKYNNKIICYDKKCIHVNNAYQLNNDLKGGYFCCPTKTFFDLWKLIDENGYEDDWNMRRIINACHRKDIPVRGQVQNFQFSHIINLCYEIETRFKASLNSFELYHQLFSSIQGFYKVLISGKHWQETCRYEKYGQICKKLTTPYSPFCFDCRSNKAVDDLLQNVVHSTGSFREKEIRVDTPLIPSKYYQNYNPPKERVLDVIPYDNEKGLYKDISYGFIVKETDDGVGCVGKLVNCVITPLSGNDIILAKEIGLLIIK